VLRPADSVREILPELRHREMRAFTCYAEIAQDFAQLRAFVLGEAGETRIGVAHWRAQLNSLKSGVGKLLDRTWKITTDHGSHGIRLTSNRQRKWIAAKLQRAGA